MPDAAEPPAWGSAALEGERFLADFEAGLYPHDRFRHADHVRLAWIYLRRFGVEEAGERIRGGIRRFARQAGAERKYHETVTIAWMRLVAIPCFLQTSLTFPDASHSFRIEITCSVV